MTKFINKRLTLILCFLMVFSLILPTFADAPSNDYDSSWAKETIQAAIDSGVVKGYPDGSFKPNNTISRAEFFSLINNIFKFTKGSETTFTDVPSGAWYAPVIAKAKAAEYITGYPDGSIRPIGNISRQEAAVIISVLKSLTAVSDKLSYTDASTIADWSKQAIIAAAETKIMIGYPDESFKPEAPITRVEALVVITRAFNHKTLVVPIDEPSDEPSEVPSDVPVAVSDITVTQETMTLTSGGVTGTINATISPAKASNQNIKWTSSDTSIATVKDGVVTPIAEGTATITATSAADETKTAMTVLTILIADNAKVESVDLGLAGDFVILTKTGISTVPSSVIKGNIGVSPIDATAITGFSLTADATNEFSISNQIIGKAYASNYASSTSSNLTTAISNMETAYTNAAGRAANYTELYSGDISGKTLAPGVYKWGTGVLINSDVTLNGNANDVWIFQIGEGITQANGIKIILAGGAQAKNIFWQVAESVSIGTGSHFEGIVLSMTNITMGTNASINGRLYAQTAVTLDASTVVAP